MFSAEYFNKAMVISTISIRRIDFKNVEKLHRLIIQLLRNPYGNIIFDIRGVKFIDSTAFNIIERMHFLANCQNIELVFTNVDSEVKELFDLVPSAAKYKIEKFADEPARIEKEVLV